MDKDTLLKVAVASFCVIGVAIAFSLLARAAWLGISAILGFGG